MSRRGLTQSLVFGTPERTSHDWQDPQDYGAVPLPAQPGLDPGPSPAPLSFVDRR
jgi:hypothetical protein